jgi:hypothetical protein
VELEGGSAREGSVKAESSEGEARLAMLRRAAPRDRSQTVSGGGNRVRMVEFSV